MGYSIVNWSVRFRRIVIAVASGMLILGVVQIDDAKQDILPEFSPVTVEVQTEALGLSAAEVEQLITVPLEQDLLNGVAFLEAIESASLPGLSSVVMTFEPGTKLLDARQVVAERLTQAGGLPQVADPPQMIQPLSSTSRVAMVSLRSTEVTPIEMSVLARWVMVPRLLGVEGVANVAIWGFRDQQLQVLVDPAELARRNVTLSQVISTTGNALEVSPLSFLEASLPGTGGFIDTVNQRLHVFHEQAITTPEELAQVTVEGIEGGAVFVDGEALELGDVADIVTDHQPLIGDAFCDAGPCLLLVIEKFPGANTPAVTAGLDVALEALSLGLSGVEIDASVYRPATFIDTAVGNLRTVMVIGAAILLLVLAAARLDWRIALIGVVTVVMSLVVAWLVLLQVDATVNAMVLAGLVAALAVIVNDAVATAWATGEAVRREHQEGQSATEAAIVDTAMRTRSIALYAAVIVAGAVMPVIAMEGAAGAFLEPIAVAYLLAIAAALAVGVTVAPALSVSLLGRATIRSGSAVDVRWRDWLRRQAAQWVRRLGGAVTLFAVLIVAGAVALFVVTPNLRPALKEPDVLIHVDAAPGTSLDRMNEITAAMVGELRDRAGIAGVGAHVGRAVMSDQVVNVNSGEVWLNVDPAADYDAALADIAVVVDRYDEVTAQVTTYSERRVSEILDRPEDELVVRVYGEDVQTRRAMAEQIRALMAEVDGIDDPRVALAAEESAIEIEVDLDRAQAFGVKPGDVRRQAATLVSGLVVGNLFEDQKVFDVVVWGVPTIRSSADDIRTLPIATPSGDQVPLGDLAEVRVAPSPSVIRHESAATYLDVIAPVSGRSIDAVAADVDVAVAELDFPLEHHAELLGGFEDVRAARTRALVSAGAALVLVYLLLQAAFSSWRLATLAFLTLPAAVTGSLIAVAATGAELTLGAVVGTVAVFGMAAREVVLVIRAFQRRERHGESFGEGLVAAVTARLAVPLVVSLAAIAGLFVPLAVARTWPGLEIVGPMAVAILGGLVTTAALVLRVLPAAYLRWGYVTTPDLEAEDLFLPHEPIATRVG